MATKIGKLNPKWIRKTRKHFLEFLEYTNFPHPQRNGQRGSRFSYPEWMIMFIAVLSVKCKVKSYIGIHNLALQYWDFITDDKELPPISESQLRDRLKKIRHSPRKPASFIFQILPSSYFN
jgi:hypothetical protein